MKLVHTLLFMLRQNHEPEDIKLAVNCLTSLVKSTSKTVVIYNQGSMSNVVLQAFVAPFGLDCHIIGDGANVGTVLGRRKCLEYIWETLPDTQYISEVHLDMLFPPNWEDKLVEYLENNDEPVISSGIIDSKGKMPFLNKTAVLPDPIGQCGDFLVTLQTDRILEGFTNPCIHKSEILRATEGYNPKFLKGRQCFEDDSMLLGYYYYYGTRRCWHPKINYNTVVYHAVAGQRLGVWDNIAVNYAGLVKQYGVMGLKALSTLHTSEWHKKFFMEHYKENIK